MTYAIDNVKICKISVLSPTLSRAGTLVFYRVFSFYSFTNLYTAHVGSTTTSNSMISTRAYEPK